jgi:hypothetical protein
MRDNRDQGIVSSMIIFAIVTLLVLAITGCATAVPVTAKFPEPPGKLATQSCTELQKLKDDAKLSDVSRTVTINYSSYYECAVKTDAWIEWYKIQKILFEGAGK